MTLKAHSAAPSHPHHGSASVSHAEGQADIRTAQLALNQQGFNVGDPDGKLGQRTKKALIAFQKQHGFKTTGKVDSATLQGLSAAISPTKGDQAAGAQQTPAQAPPSVPAEPAPAGQGSPTPAAASQQPAEGETPPDAVQDGRQLPDASSRVPAGSPQEDYKDDSVPPGNDQK
jgi:peptidoglycan hydrolase-like protein with peptidoglycan-binding domain